MFRIEMKPKAKHPALEAYEAVFNRIAANTDDASLMPAGSGDIVGRARLESELRRRSIEFPENVIDELNWWEEIGGCKLAKRLTRKFNRERAASHLDKTESNTATN